MPGVFHKPPPSAENGLLAPAPVALPVVLVVVFVVVVVAVLDVVLVDVRAVDPAPGVVARGFHGLGNGSVFSVPA